MRDPQFVLVCLRADAAQTHPQIVLGNRCKYCQTEVKLFPTGQAVMRDKPDVTLCCEPCYRENFPTLPSVRGNSTPAEYERELRESIPPVEPQNPTPMTLDEFTRMMRNVDPARPEFALQFGLSTGNIANAQVTSLAGKTAAVFGFRSPPTVKDHEEAGDIVNRLLLVIGCQIERAHTITDVTPEEIATQLRRYFGGGVG